MFREAASQRIETSTDRRSVTSKDDLGFTAPLVSGLCPQLAPEGCGVPVKPSKYYESIYPVIEFQRVCGIFI